MTSKSKGPPPRQECATPKHETSEATLAQTARGRKPSPSPFLAGTQSAWEIEQFILGCLDPVVDKEGEPSEKLYVYRYAGLIGQLAPRDKPDRNGRIGFLLYEKKSVDAARLLSFRRDRKNYPRAPRPIFLTATNVFAH